MVSNPRGTPRNAQCQQWSETLWRLVHGCSFRRSPDYEVRRELIRNGATVGLQRLDHAGTILNFAPITRDVMIKAAELWAQARNRGLPTAARALDGDVILAPPRRLLATGPGDVVTVATDNVGHLAQFVDAQPWEKIVP